ncbi:cytochrome c maturation protein CcmE [Legionella londiniensis]|uniref:Cytochrome c-type biogenesis protein CcmE n=1 Tax=Legionella londiniensis TaxID=45068 RepID=A0A0W0VM66_9GAMM|nr:cytochrome c maturation protein CcmE [Legionella londiniensis]KTD21199.1 cytochrome c-type biogenesis protein CcmE [Legionella londiniensis]STX93224.1 cytochrome c-type biogenesis protein CcmE [Legionella londiniensis]
MNAVRKRKLLMLLLIVLILAIATALALFALKQNINLFYSPSEVVAGKAPLNHPIRVGGMVVKGSVIRNAKDLSVRFKITDFRESFEISYQGSLPDLFREGQGIVAQGVLVESGQFKATEVLAKHDENYMPPEVKDALARAKG